MFERGMAWFVLHDPPNHDASALHCRSLVYVGVRPVFLFPAFYSPAYVYKAGAFFEHRAVWLRRVPSGVVVAYCTGERAGASGGATVVSAQPGDRLGNEPRYGRAIWRNRVA